MITPGEPLPLGPSPRRETSRTPIDDALLRIGHSKDRDAFLELTRWSAPRLKGWIMRSVPDEARAEELVQDVLITVWRRASTFDPCRGSGWGWLFTLARNRVIDVARRHRFSAPDPTDPTWIPDIPTAPDDAASDAHTRSAVQAALADLPPEQRAILEMAYFKSMSFAEIALAEDISLGTAKSRARLGLERLRARLTGLEAA